jgi:hypothetical protein
MFDDIAGLRLPKTARMIDVGSQDIGMFNKVDLDRVNRFLHMYGGAQLAEPSQWPYIVEAKEVFQSAGFAYLRCDVDERPETIYVDLAKLEFPRNYRNALDLVVNVGTTEHLANPVGGFALMHYLTKVGGIMFHDVPLFGYGNHGLNNPTPKFWHALVWMNAYELIGASVKITDESKFDRGNFYQDYLSYIHGLAEAGGKSSTIRVILRKTRERVFIPPYDAVLPDSDGEKEARLVWGSLYPFICTSVYSVDDVVKGINDFMAMMGRPYRMSREFTFRQLEGSDQVRPQGYSWIQKIKSWF